MENKTNILSLTPQDTSALKGIAIVAMQMHHLWGCAPPEVESYSGALGFWGSIGKVCVAVSLFCSGYGLSVGYEKMVYSCAKKKSLLIESIRFVTRRLVKF